MKSTRLLFASLLVMLFSFNFNSANAQTAFTAGNLVVVRVGSGSGSLATSATQVGVSEYSTAGSLQRTLTFQSSTTIPSSGAAPFLNESGSTANEAFGTTSIDGNYFCLLGYNTTNGTLSVNGVTSNRSIGRANVNGSLAYPVTNTTFGNANTIRSVASDGNNFWATTSQTAAGSGLACITTSGTVTTLNGLNGRCVAIFNGQLFASSSSTVQSFGTGLPTTGSPTATTIATVTNADAFSFNPTHDVLYVADESAVNTTNASTSGGVRKFTRSGSTWTLTATFNEINCRGIIVDYSGSSPVIYGTEAAASANKIFKIVDDGTAKAINSSNVAIGTVSYTTIVAGITNIRLAGIAFAPGTPSIVLSSLTSGTATTASVAPFNTYADGYTSGGSAVATATCSFVVNGYNLTTNTLTVTAPTNFEVSTSATSGFASSLTLTPTSGSVSNKTIYVRMIGGLTTATYSGNVTVKTTTASLCPQWANVAVSGTVTPATPAITSPASLPISLSGFLATTLTASSAQTFTLSANNLTSALTITTAAPFQISTPTVNGGAYSTSLNVGTTVSNLIISVRIASGNTVNTSTSGTIVTSTSDAGINGLTLANLSGTIYSGSFSANNLAVEVIGDGVNTKSAAACQVNVWEFNNTGTIQNKFPFTPNSTLPTATPFNVTTSANATSEGNLNLSADGTQILVAGYNAIIGTGSIASSSSATNLRVLATTSQNNTQTTNANNIFSANNIRSIASNGYSYWIAGTPTGGAGLYYLFNKNATPVSMGSINTRVIKTFNKNLYYSSAVTGNVGIFQVGTNGYPISPNAATITRLTPSTYVGSPYGFAINSSNTIMYVADDGAFSSTSAMGGGILKFTNSGSGWTFAYTLRVLSAVTLGARGLEVDWSGSNPIIYCVSGASSNTSNDLVKIIDAGSSSVGTSISTALSLYVYRGVQFAPQDLATAQLYCTSTALAFGGEPQNSVSAEQSFNVSGNLFSGNISVTAPAEYGVSLTAGGPYSSSVTITGGAPANATIYMVFEPSATATLGAHNGNLVISATGATTLNVPVTGSVINPTNYYNAANTDLTNPQNWFTNANGTGSNPTNFTDDGQYFNLVNAFTPLANSQTSDTLSLRATTTNGANYLTFSANPSCPQSPASLYVGATITGAGIPANTTITAISGTTFTISNNATASATVAVSVPVNSPWTISGTSSKLVVGNGTNAFSFTIPSTYAYNGIVDVKNNATLVLQNSTLPTFGNLDLNSTVNYNQTGSVSVVAATYGNLTLQGAALDTRTLPYSSNITFPFVVNGNFIADNVKVYAQSISPYTFMTLGGDFTMLNGAVMVASTPTSTANMLSVVTSGNNTQTFTYTNGTIRLLTLNSTKSAGGIVVAANTTLLLNGNQTPTTTYGGMNLNFSGNAVFTTLSGASLNATGIANITLNFTGTSTFTLGGDLNTSDNSSTSFGTTPSSSLIANFATGTSFVDAGNTITVSGNLGLGGVASAYTLTGNAVIATRTGTSTIGDDALINSIVPTLRKFTFAPIGGSSTTFVGTGNVNIADSFSIKGTATTNKISGGSNTINLSGNYVDTRTVDMISAGTTVWNFNGTSAQTFSTAYTSGESLNSVSLNNAAGLTLSNGYFKIGASGTLTCTNGILTTGTNTIQLNATGSIIESSSSYVLGNISSTRTLTTATNNFGGLGFTVSAVAAPGSTTVLRNTGTSNSIGCASKSILRTFTVTNSGTSLNANISLAFDTINDLNGLTLANLKLYNVTSNAALSGSSLSGNILSASGLATIGGVYSASLGTTSLSSVSQLSSICNGNAASMKLTGLLPYSTSTVAYNINNGITQTINNVVADSLGNANFNTVVLNSANNGQTLNVTSITRTDLTSTCTNSFTNISTTLAVHQAPIISAQPQTVNNTCVGASASFNVTASGFGTLSYQWQDSTATGWQNISNGTTANGTSYAGATTANLLVANFPYLMNGHKYHVTVNGGCNPLAVSQTVMLNIRVPSTTNITGTQSVVLGNSATLIVNLTGTAPWTIRLTDGSNKTTYTNITTTPYSISVSPNKFSTYKIDSLVDGNGCILKDSTYLTGSAIVDVYAINDQCVSAIALNLTVSCTPVAGTSFNGHASTTATCTGSGLPANADDDVWYELYVPSGLPSFTIAVQATNNFDAAFEVLKGNCGALQSVACVNNSSVTTGSGSQEYIVLNTNLTGTNTTIYIRVYDARTGWGQANGGNGQFQICTYGLVLPTNGTPCTATNMSTNVGSIGNLPTQVLAYSNGVDPGLVNDDPNGTGTGLCYTASTIPASSVAGTYKPVAANLVYMQGTTAFAYSSSSTPMPPTITNPGGNTQKVVWFNFNAPTVYDATVDLNMNFANSATYSSATQQSNWIIALYTISGGGPCTSPVFTPVYYNGTTSPIYTTTGKVTITGADFSYNNLAGQPVYAELMLPSGAGGNYLMAIHASVPNITLQNPTTSTLTATWSGPFLGVNQQKLSWRARPNPATNWCQTVLNLPGYTFTYVPTNSTSYTINSLISGNIYDAWMTYYGTNSNAFNSKTITLGTTVGCSAQQPAPSILPVVGHCSKDTVQIPTIVTTNIPLISSYPYRVYWYKQGSTGYSVVATNNLKTPIVGLQVNGITYNYLYSAICQGGASVVSATTSQATCFGAAAPNPNTDPTNEHTMYEVNGVYFVDMDIRDVIMAAEATHPDLADGQVHYYPLHRVDAEGSVTTSTEMADVLTGGFDLIPNPTTNRVKVQYNLPEENLSIATIKLMDISGRVIRAIKLDNPTKEGYVSMDLTDLNSGIYLVNVQTEGYTETKKLVVSK